MSRPACCTTLAHRHTRTLGQTGLFAPPRPPRLLLLSTLLPVDILLKDALKYFRVTWQLLKLTFTWRQPHAGRGVASGRGSAWQHIIECPIPPLPRDSARVGSIASTFTVPPGDSRSPLPARVATLTPACTRVKWPATASKRQKCRRKCCGCNYSTHTHTHTHTTSKGRRKQSLWATSKQIQNVALHCTKSYQKQVGYRRVCACRFILASMLSIFCCILLSAVNKTTQII